jgi:hypothetical protein
MKCHTELVEVSMIQAAVTPVKRRAVYVERSRNIAFRSSVVLLLN